MRAKLSSHEKNIKVVGPALAEVLPQTDKWWFQQPHLLRLNALLCVPLLSSSISGFDGSLMNGLQSLPQWTSDFGDPQGTTLGLVNACLVIGMIGALPIVPWVSDRFGRNKPIIFGAIGTIVATVIQCVSVNYGMFCFSRALLGFCSSFMITPSAMLITELAYPTHRGKYSAIFFTTYYVGAIVASWVTFGTQSLSGSQAWQVPSAFQALLPAIQLALMWWVPMSPRWLVAVDRVGDARRVLNRYHDPDAIENAGEDAESSPLVLRELSEIVESIRMEQDASATTWSALVATPGNRRRLLIACIVGLFAQWNGVAVLSYYLTKVLNSVGITDVFDQTLINGMLQIFNFLAAVAGALLVDRLGRRTLFLWSTAGMLLSYIVWTACSATYTQTGSQSLGIVVVVCVFVVFFHYDIAWTPLLIAYPAEIFPYSLRAKGLAVEFFCNSAGLLVAQFANPEGLDALGWKYYIVFACILAVLTTLIYFLFPETKGYTLEEIAVLFDGEAADVTDAAMGKRSEAGDLKTAEQIEFREV